MKKLLLILLFASVSLFAEEIKILVPGMVCQMCVQGMQKQFKSAVIDAEKDVSVDLDKKIVTVKTKDALTDEEIKKRVQNAGYNAEKITRVTKIKTLKPKKLMAPERKVKIEN